MKSKVLIFVILILTILGIVISGCIKKNIEPIPQDELEKICTEKSWPPNCNVISDTEGRNLCEKCKELMGEETEKGLIKEKDITQLTFLDNLAGDPSWSPDGNRLVFLGLEKNMMKGGLYVMNSNGTGLFKIAGQWGRNNLFNPSWSPVNNKIICHASGLGGGPGGNGLFLVDLDEDQTKKVQLTPQRVEHVSWNHNGKKIAYNVYGEYNPSSNDYKSSSIWVMDANGNGQIQLTTKADGFCTCPSFSYDGSKIVYLKGFTTTMPGEKPEKAINEIWIMNNDGTNKYIIYAPGDSMQLIRERAWNKDNKIIFTKHIRQGAPQIWVINSDGTNPRCVFNPEEEGIPTAIYDDPVWDNSGTKVAVTKVLVSDESWHIATFSWSKEK